MLSFPTYRVEHTPAEWVTWAQQQALHVPAALEKLLQLPAVPVEAAPVVDVPAIEATRPSASPQFTMTKAAMIGQHKHQWPSIERDMQDANRNGLNAAKAGARGWREAMSLEWARANGRLESNDAPDALRGAINTMASLPTSRTHTL